MKKHLFVLLACLFVVMIGFGITLPVLPFYVERLALEAGASQQSIVLHVTLLTGVYALMQLIFAPLWGRWSDRIGRRPLILVGIAGYVIAQSHVRSGHVAVAALRGANCRRHFVVGDAAGIGGLRRRLDDERKSAVVEWRGSARR